MKLPMHYLFVAVVTPSAAPCPPAPRRYPADGLGGQDSLFGAIGDGCARLDAKYTMQSMGAGAPTPSA